MSEEKPDWKAMAGLSSRKAARDAARLQALIVLSKRLLDTLPGHWHDTATVELRDFIEELERNP